MPLTLKACAESLREFPELNARLEGDEIVLLDRYDLGVAVQTDQGLVVPVVRGCADRPRRRARGRREAPRRGGTRRDAEPEELRGSTFTVTSAGKLGGPLPDAARQPPRGRDPEPGPDRRPARRPATARSSSAGSATSRVTFDHRVVDGARAAEFGLAVIRRLENPP